VRVLVVRPGPQFSVQDVCSGWVKALRNLGCQVVDFNLDDRLNFYEQVALPTDTGEWRKALSDEAAVKQAAKGVEVACYEVWPDIVLIVSGFFIPDPLYELMRARGHKIVLLHTESPYEDRRQLRRAPLADLNLLNDPTNLHLFQDVAPSYYVPHAYDPDIHHPRSPDPSLASDFCFVGTGYESRIGFLENVDWGGLDVKLGGNWGQLNDDSPLLPFLVHHIDECIDNRDAASLYAAAKCSANLYRKEAEPGMAEGWAMGPREVELAACGTFFLRQPRGEGDEVLDMLPTFTDSAELGDLVRYYTRHDSERTLLAQKAREAVADRTFEANAKRLLAILA
jgi:spore maturation protein CgeB